MPVVVASLLAGLAACATTPPAQQKPAAAEPEAQSVAAAEEALKRGDCRSASETLARAAAHGDVQTARRATQVAVACEHLPAAWQSASRWRTLAPDDREANALYAAVALKLYRTSDARAAIADFWRVEGQKNTTGNAAAAPPAKASERTARSMTELSALLLEEDRKSTRLNSSHRP